MLLPETQRALESIYGPVEAAFTVTQIPEGAAPQEIKEQWIGIELPVRAVNVSRFVLGAMAKYVLPLPRHDHNDALTGQSASYNYWPISVCGLEAIDRLQKAGRDAAAEFWTPYGLGIFTFKHYEGELKSLD